MVWKRNRTWSQKNPCLNLHLPLFYELRKAIQITFPCVICKPTRTKKLLYFYLVIVISNEIRALEHSKILINTFVFLLSFDTCYLICSLSSLAFSKYFIDFCRFSFKMQWPNRLQCPEESLTHTGHSISIVWQMD